MTNIECPVCNSIITGNVCGKCGYVRIVFPKAVSDTIIRFERERVDALRSIMKKTATDMADAKRNAESARRRSESLDRELEDSKKRFTHINQDREVLRTENRQLNQTLRSLEKENENIRLESSNEVQKLKEEISYLKTNITQQDFELKALKSKFANATQELAQARDSVTDQLRGIVIIEDVRHGIKSAFPIYDGVNTYGSNSDSGLHHQIRFNVRGYSFKPVHFTIRTSPKGLILEANSNAELYQNGGLVHSAVYARQADNFMFSDKVKLNITTI